LIPKSFGRGRGSVSRTEPTSLAADIAELAKKPELPKPIIWNIYKIAGKAVRLGAVEGSKAAAEFKVPANRLMAVRR
jgi:hypothetical protein